MVRVGLFGSRYFEQFAMEIQKDAKYAEVSIVYVNDENISDFTAKAAELDEMNLDVILSGPVNHSRITRYLRTPSYTIHISIPGFLGLHSRIRDYERTAFLFCSPEQMDFTLLREALHVDFHVFYYHYQDNVSDLSRILEGLKDQGYTTIVGTRNVVVNAQALGLEALYYYSRQNVEDAIDSALQIVENMRRTTVYMEEIRSILENSMSGVLSITGEEHTISYVNRTAAGMIRKNPAELLKQPVKRFLPDQHILRLIEHQKSENAVQFSLCGIDMIGNILSAEFPDGGHYSFLMFENVSGILEYETMIRKRIRLETFGTRYSFEGIIGSSPALLRAMHQARRFAASDSAVLIQAETGSGKEVFAQSIHADGPRRDYPFVAINCASMPDSLIESELFGYTAGAFTGASSKGKVGLIETANHGTVFLDDIDAISPSFQAKLLRVMQEKEIIRIGGDRTIPVDVRFIIASNRNLKGLVAEGKFRNDLYYRISVLTLNLPPLRERREDIPLLFQSYLRGRDPKLYAAIRPHFQESFAPAFRYHYPGNIRELVSITERFTALAEIQRIGEPGYLQELIEDCLYPDPGEREKALSETATTARPDYTVVPEAPINSNPEGITGNPAVAGLPYSRNYADNLAAAERSLLSAYLSAHGGNVSETAREIGLSRAALYSKIKALGIPAGRKKKELC